MSTDRFGRRVDYLRISITDRCNMRCTYCMPPGGIELRPRDEILSAEQIERVAAAALTQGFSKLRVTGGEPLVRAGAPALLGRLVRLAGSDSVALTTNGVLLPRFAEELADAGLTRVNISLDSLDPERFARITRGGRLGDSLAGLRAAVETGFAPVKVNALATAGLLGEIDAFLTLVAENPVHVRFIERMPIGQNCSPAADEAPLEAAELLAAIAQRADALGLGELVPTTDAERPAGWGPARYYRLAGAQGTVGVIAPMTRHFCGTCSRLRLTADGTLRPCLFSATEVSLADALAQPGDAALVAAVRQAVALRPEGHELAGIAGAGDRSMHEIGG